MFLVLAPTPAAMRADSPTPTPSAGCSAPLALTLRPGLAAPINHAALPAAPDIPPGPVVIHVPLYRGALAATLPMQDAAYSYPASRYLKSATAEYQISTDWTTASNWYRQAFVACGYTEAGHELLTARGVTVSIGITMRGPTHPPLEVALAFTHGPSNATLVLYLAYTIALPPPVTMVPGTPSGVTILSYLPLVPGQLAADSPSEYVVVRDTGSIEALVHRLNSLPPPQGVMSCPADDGSHDELLFAYPDGHRVTVDVGLRGCRIVRSGNKAAMALTDNGLYTLLAALLACPSVVHLGAPFDARTLRLAARRARTSDGSASFLDWNPGGMEYVYLDRGALWVADRDNRWRPCRNGAAAVGSSATPGKPAREGGDNERMSGWTTCWCPIPIRGHSDRHSLR